MRASWSTLRVGGSKKHIGFRADATTLIASAANKRPIVARLHRPAVSRILPM